MARPRRVKAELALATDERVPVQERRGLTAAGQRIAEDAGDARKYRRISQPWQQSVFTYYNTVPECWFPAQFYARSLSMIRIYAARRDEQGEVKELPASDPAAKLLARIRDPSGGTSQLFAAYGRLRFLIGECFLVVTQKGKAERWECLSNREIRAYENDRAKFVRVRAPGLDPEELEDDEKQDLIQFEPLVDGETANLSSRKTQAVVWRLWRRHPEFSYWADAPTRAVVDLYEELILLQLAVRARAKSRLANAGILLLAQELDFSVPGEDKDDQKQDSFMDRLQRAMTTPIRDPGSAKAVVPIVGRIPAELMDKAYALIKIHDPKETYPEEGLRNECVRRISMGLDMPPETLLGMSDVNHWGSWQIDEAEFKKHIKPVCQELVDDLTAIYLLPAAEQEGIEDWESLVVGYDPAELVVHPDRGKDAKDLQSAGAIRWETLREATGFKDSDALIELDEEEEFAVWLAVTLNKPEMLPEKYRPEQATAQDATDQPQPEVQGPPDTKPSENGGEAAQKEAQSESVTAAIVMAMAGLTARRARELAGSRLRSKVNGKYKDTPNADLAAEVGADGLSKLGLTASALVEGSGLLFQEALRDEVGVDPQAALKLAELVESYSARTLCQPLESLPDQFAGYVRRVV